MINFRLQSESNAFATDVFRKITILTHPVCLKGVTTDLAISFGSTILVKSKLKYDLHLRVYIVINCSQGGGFVNLFFSLAVFTLLTFNACVLCSIKRYFVSMLKTYFTSNFLKMAEVG